MGCRHDLLTGEPERAYGIGGSVDCYPEAATIAFADDDGEYSFDLIIDVVRPDPNPDAVVNELPSLLGRDFIKSPPDSLWTTAVTCSDSTESDVRRSGVRRRRGGVGGG